jgi:cysteine desulfurase
VADLIGAHPREIIFTSYAAESNNAAIHAVLKVYPDKRHIITSAAEHSSVRNYRMELERAKIRIEQSTLECGWHATPLTEIPSWFSARRPG